MPDPKTFFQRITTNHNVINRIERCNRAILKKDSSWFNIIIPPVNANIYNEAGHFELLGFDLLSIILPRIVLPQGLSLALRNADNRGMIQNISSYLVAGADTYTGTFTVIIRHLRRFPSIVDRNIWDVLNCSIAHFTASAKCRSEDIDYWDTTLPPTNDSAEIHRRNTIRNTHVYMLNQIDIFINEASSILHSWTPHDSTPNNHTDSTSHNEL